MAETTEPPSDAGTSQADAMALAAEAEAAEAEALARLCSDTLEL